METVQILMSTYNGEKYLRAQLNSLLKQTYPLIEILIRDDGSQDGTVEILEEYAKKYDHITYYRGPNLGVIQSFLQLLKDSNDHASYYAFADQDDVWLPEKVARAVEMISKTDSKDAVLYCGDTYITDENLNVIKKEDKAPRPSFGNALVQNICTGCTAVMNKALRDMINETRPVNIVMHDWWFYLSAVLHGQVIYDQKAYIYYRQHGNNEWGVKVRKIDVLKHRLKQLTAKRGYIYAQNVELNKEYQITDYEKRRLLELVQKSRHGLIGKIKLVMERKIYRNSRENDFVYRLSVLLGKL